MMTSTRCALLATLCVSLAPNCLGFSGIRPYMTSIPAYSSPLFRTTSRIVVVKTALPASAANNEEPINSEKAPEAASFPSSSKSSSKNKKETSGMLEKLDYFGQSLKPRAVEKKGELAHASTRKQKLWLGLQTCAYFSLFIFYRAYRGFFVLLPAVFSEVYTKMEKLDSPFVDEPGQADVNPDTGKLRWRTRITVSILAAMVTMTYVVGGIANVLAKFVKSLTQTSSPTSSFEAAADETQRYEVKIEKMTRKDVNETNLDDGISGTLSP